MKVVDTRTVRYTTFATVVADEGETLTREMIEERFFFPFGGHITGMNKDIAHIEWYND